jgi:hypothetical protein
MLLGVAAALAVAGCGGGSDATTAAPTYVKATGLPAPTAVAKDGSTVPAGTWAVVRTSRPSSQQYGVLAVQVTSMVKGDAGALKDVRSLAGPPAVDLATAVPFYVSVGFSNLAGYKLADPNMSLFGSDRAGADTGFATLSVASDLKKCTTPDDGNYAGDYGFLQHRCILVASAGPAPAALTYTTAGGSKDVHFTIPAG